MAYICVDPWHMKEDGRFEEISDGRLSLVVNDVHRSWLSWRASDTGKRKRCLKSLGDLLLEEGIIAGDPYKVVIGVPEDSPLEAEEVFGPVAPVFRFRNTWEAASMANSSVYGLGFRTGAVG